MTTITIERSVNYYVSHTQAMLNFTEASKISSLQTEMDHGFDEWITDIRQRDHGYLSFQFVPYLHLGNERLAPRSHLKYKTLKPQEPQEMS